MKYDIKINRFWIICFCLFSSSLWAQPENDDCAGAINLFDIANWCSPPGEFNNNGATASQYSASSCFGSVRNDVWFSFTTIATDVTITINGAITSGAGGTMSLPAVTLYSGTCGGSLSEQRCVSDRGNNTIELYKGGLIVGQEYLIRVQSGSNSDGSFQLCINNYNPPVNPGSDCITASVLCDKSQFVVQQVTGGGSDNDELGNSSCLGGFPGASESNSTWFVWTAQNDGPLSFTLTPLRTDDDLDFVVYELPEGIGNCLSKSELRCMASGAFEFPSPCMGPTGLRENEPDTSEPPGCADPSQNNFISPLDMETGKSYALAINNFSESGNGFSIEFGGAGEFLGPQAAFNTDAPASGVCYGEEVSFNDASSFSLGSLTSWEWSFGVGAEPATASGQGPHDVVWNSPGTKSVVLTVESDLGCVVTEIETIEVLTCCNDQNAMTVTPTIEDVRCADIPEGFIELDVVSNAPEHTFQWSTGSIDNNIRDLIAGDYMVTITNEATCDTVLTYTVGTPNAMQIDTLIQMPTCNGGVDGSITFNITEGVPPYAFNWNDGNGFVVGNNSLENLSVGTYDVSIRDANGCREDLSIEVNELLLVLDPTVNAITQPSCFGTSDGSIVVLIDNGLPPFEYDWNDGNGFVGENSLLNIASGTYSVRVRDRNNCEGNFTFEVEDHPPLEAEIEVIDVSCFGAGDGNLIAHATGGFGSYTFSWNDGQRDSSAMELEPGDYTVVVQDANGCETEVSAMVTQPDELFLDVSDIQDVLCNSEPTGTVSVIGSGGNPPFEYSVDGVNFQPEASFPGLAAGDYSFTVQDQLNCTATVDASVSEPPPLIVDAGPDQKVDLGFSTVVNTVTSPPLRPVVFNWSADPDSLTLSCSDCPNPTASPANSSIYTVTITDETGCTATDQVMITVVKNRPIFIPNVFSPNFDGINDYFTLFGGPAALEIQTLRIFDRWGALIFETRNIPLNDETFGWDGEFRGKKVSPGVYAYYAEVAFIDNEVLLFKGDITITR